MPKKSDGKDETVKTSIKVHPDLWKEAKIEAIRHNMELSDLTEQALRKEVERLKKLGGV